MSGIWWTKMEHKEDFCEHFCEMSDKEIVADIRKSINSFLKQRADGADFGAKMVKKALDRITSKHDSAVANGSLGGQATAAKNKSPQDAPNGNAGVDVSDAGNGAASKSPTSCDQFTADGDIREDSQAKPDGSAITRNETRAHDALEPSANNYGDAATSEGAEVVADVRKSMDDLEDLVDDADSFGSKMVRWSMERADQPFATAARENGKKGGRPRKDSVEDGARESQRRAGADSVRGTPSHRAPARSSGPMPADVHTVYAFAAAENLDPVDAYECWHVTVNERGGLTQDGKRITNWKAYVRKWCETRASNRRTA